MRTASYGAVAACQISWRGNGEWGLFLTGGTSTQTPAMGKIVLRLLVQPAMATHTLDCTAGSIAGTGSTSNTLSTTFVELHTQQTAFDYVELVRH